MLFTAEDAGAESILLMSDWPLYAADGQDDILCNPTVWIVPVGLA